jgi:hypothetical protein
MDEVNRIKRIIGKPGFDGEANLYIGTDGDGAAWATNRYWAVRATQIEPLMDRYNLKCDAPGSYCVASIVKKLDDNPVGISQYTQLSKFKRELRPVTVDGFPAAVRLGDSWFAVLAVSKRKRIGVQQDWLDWLYGTGYREHLLWDGHQVGITDDEFELVSPGHYELDGDAIGNEYQTGAQYIEPEYRVKETRLTAVIMPFKFTAE